MVCTELIGFLLEFWSKVISNFNQFSQSETKHLSTQIVQHGIPSALRGTVWRLLTKTGGDEGLQEVYMALLKQASVYEKAITRDLHRTFPHHPYFQSHQGQESLFNVVKAYSLYDPEVGYCQGLAFVAGPLLLNVNRIKESGLRLTGCVRCLKKKRLMRWFDCCRNMKSEDNSHPSWIY